VNGNAEELRASFVKHEGKKDLITFQMATLRTADCGKLAGDMVDELKNILWILILQT
jgi:hypothetical protein